MQQTLLIAGHGGMAALCGGALVGSGHGMGRQEMHEHHGDDSNLSSVRVEALVRVSTCAVVRR